MARTQRVADDFLSFRESVDFGTTIDEEDRSIDAVAATEQPVMVPDWERGEMVPEVLLMSGVKFPNTRTVPLLNSHARMRAEDVIGSATDLRVEGGELKARVRFSQAADSIFTRVREKHLNDVSVGYRVERKRYVPADQTEVISGREFTGPVSVVTSWRLSELSVTPIGADDQAKMRGVQWGQAAGSITDESNSTEDFQMTKLLRRSLVERGMPEDLDDAKVKTWLAERGMPADTESVDDWVADNLDKIDTRKKVDPKPEAKPESKTVDVETIAARAAEAVAERLAAKMEADRAARAELDDAIISDCNRYGFDDETRQQFMAAKSLEEARGLILEHLAKNDGPELGRSVLGYGPSQREKHVDSIRTSLLMNAYEAAGIGEATIDKDFPKEQRKHAPEFQYASLLDLARSSLIAAGVNVRGMSQVEIAQRALGFGNQVRAEGYHFAGHFANITLDAINKIMSAAYVEYPFTWQAAFGPRAIGPDAKDFKTHNVISMSAAPNLMLWPNNTAMKEIGFTDEKETYAVKATGETASFSWQLLVNDDMDALARVPAEMGQAAARTINTGFYNVITTNPTMGDGQTLFLETPAGNRKNANDNSTASTPPSVAAIQTLKSLMRLQTGPNDADGNESVAILNLMPNVLLVPTALETTAVQLVMSAADPASSGNSGIYNPARGMALVVEPLLDANSTTAWYLISHQRPSIRISFLQGQRTPVTNSWRDNETWSLKYQIAQTYAIYPYDFRPLARQTGA